jgi:hypothetical protein
VLVLDGPDTETKEHIGGFWILEAVNMDAVLAWARKDALACRAPGEVREILFKPDPRKQRSSLAAATSEDTPWRLVG